ncbi:MotA/TolQ/ExbB proton channel family protein [Adhaeribacter aquaticus]|uniref:MotA/TolQ/ExbB proton channel family protein n=1 Tax=Adhaeribacter aquaticus TaxID=299567 RepID=UPI000424980D|nr:MotA/TolQ/ExbB proton channel family protein [Adhaeribacter aquaticus]
MHFTLLQIATGADSTNSVTAGNAAPEPISLLDLAMAGGWAMIPLVVLSIAGIYIFVERFLALKKAESSSSTMFVDKIKGMVLAGDVTGARLLCAQTNTPVSRMLSKGISRIGNPLKDIEAAIENVGKIEVSALEKNLSALATVAGAAPMMGFLGTVTGMIQAFIAIAQAEGSVSPKLLSSGIYEAMVTTAAGLIIGLPAYVGYNYLVSKMDKIVHSMEYSAIEFMDLLQEPQL